MSDRELLIQTIRDAFGENVYPGDPYIQGSFEGCEPSEEVGPFQEKKEWMKIEADFLDAHTAALNFFSEAGFRFFLPAYLIAEARGLLKYVDPLFYITHGFSEVNVEVPAGGRTFTLRTGRSKFMNPRRYGAMTFHDYARYRLSVFTREEAKAIIAYLRYRRETNPGTLDQKAIDAALEGFWLDRAESAPTSESLKQDVAEQAEYLAAVLEQHKD